MFSSWCIASSGKNLTDYKSVRDRYAGCILSRTVFILKVVPLFQSLIFLTIKNIYFLLQHKAGGGKTQSPGKQQTTIESFLLASFFCYFFFLFYIISILSEPTCFLFFVFCVAVNKTLTFGIILLFFMKKGEPREVGRATTVY